MTCICQESADIDNHNFFTLIILTKTLSCINLQVYLGSYLPEIYFRASLRFIGCTKTGKAYARTKDKLR